jgi:DNA-directed RNA polymerase specialized sigma24 family protein
VARSLPDPDLSEHLAHALARLSAPERRLVRRIFWDGSTPEELAGVTGVSQEALLRRKSRILLKLRRILRDPI